MKYNKDLDFFRAILIGLVILIHIVNFGNIYPDIKNAILAFFMPAFLVITGYLVNIEKTLRQFALYLWKIWLPYMLLVLGFAGLSLYLPVRDGITSFDVPTVLDVLFVKSIGPYWFLHVMMVCGILYYAAFRVLPKLDITAKYSLFAALLIGVSLFTPLLDIHAAFYYFLGVGVRQYIGDFSRIYKASLWPILPFGLLIVQREYWGWGTIAMLVCVVSFFCFAAYFSSLTTGRTKQVIDYIGRNTFPIYIFHPIFTMLSKYYLPLFGFDPTGLLHAFVTVGVGLGGTLALALLLDRTRLSYLFGRKRILR